MSIDVLYEDEWLLVVNKPAGLLIIPSPKDEARTLTDILNEDLKKRNITWRLHPCHRLDRNTSGLMIYAKGKSLQKQVMDLFAEKKVKKTYVAFVQGALPRPEAEIKMPIEGRSAVTRYCVVQEKPGYTVVDVMPATGRTNQIRLHFKMIGHPIVGEDKFAFRKDFPLRAKRLCLHAQSLEFPHPMTHQPVRIICDLPHDMREFLEKH
jgi:23S rRNA pseudouridine1911/1915/1917 synthase